MAISSLFNYFTNHCFVLSTGVSASCQSTGGLSFKCTDVFQGRKLQLSVEVKSCRKPMKIKTSLQINALGIDWEHESDTAQEIPIPGFAVGGFGVYLRVALTTLNNGNIQLKVFLLIIYVRLFIVVEFHFV